MIEGRKDDKEKPDWTLIPWSGLVDVVRVLEFGANKYGRDNWQNVPDAKRRYLAAAFRHLILLSEGEWLDPESNRPHAAHAICCLLFILVLNLRVSAS